MIPKWTSDLEPCHIQAAEGAKFSSTTGYEKTKEGSNIIYTSKAALAQRRVQDHIQNIVASIQVDTWTELRQFVVKLKSLNYNT